MRLFAMRSSLPTTHPAPARWAAMKCRWLMLSGIGPAAHLEEVGITPTHSLPGVGQNLQDHLEIYLQMACTQPVSLFKYYNLLGKARVGAQWLFTRTGLGASNSFEIGGFIRSRVGVQHPDLQYHFFPMAVRYDGNSPNNSHGFQAHVGPMRSQSKGWVKLRSSNPDDDPRICFNYLSKDEDMEEFRAAVRLTREIFAQSAMAPYRGEIAAKNYPQVPRYRVMRISMRLFAMRSSLPTTHPAPARWAAMKCRWLMLSAGSAVLTACALSIHRSCRRSSVAT